jgi:hypothetical protein
MSADPVKTSLKAAAASCMVWTCAALAPAYAGAEQDCTVGNVAGTFGQYGGGTVFSGNALGAPVGPFTGIGLVRFDGQGNYIIINATLSFSGVISQNISGRGTYPVNANCTGFLAETSGVTGISSSSTTAMRSLQWTPLRG